MRRTLMSAGLAGLLATSVVAGTGVGTADAQTGGSNKLTVTAGEYVYKTSGKPKAGNVELTFTNDGIEYHEVVMMQVKKNVTLKQVKEALASEDESAGDDLIVGEVAPLPAFLSPGRSSTTVVNLKSGKYVLVCFVPAPDGTPHFAHGMVKLLNVRGKSSYKPPTDGVTDVTISDNEISVPASGLPKSAWVKVTNESSVPRSLLLAQYTSPDATYEAADAYYDALFAGNASGEAPADLAGGVFGLAPNASAYIEVDLDAGRYALVSDNEELEDDPNTLHTDFEVS